MPLNQQDKECKDVLGEDDIYDPLLDDLDLATLMQEEDEDGFVEALENPTHEAEGEVATQEKPGIPGVVRDGDRSRHERSTSTLTSGATGATPLANGQQPGPSRDTTYSTPIVPDEEWEKQDQEDAKQDERMDTQNVNDDVIPARQGSPTEKLQTLLERKAHLRQVLLRAEHHRVFLDKCKTGNIIPKGLRLNREIHFMRGNETCQTARTIEDMLSRTETSLMDLLLQHYDDLISSLTSTVQITERKIQTKDGYSPTSANQK